MHASTLCVLFIGDGWVTGEERLWQADLVRCTRPAGSAYSSGGVGDGHELSDEISRGYTYRIEVDGAASEHRAATVVVANSGYYGSGMRIAPRASVTDGLLDVVVIRAASRLQLIWWLPKLYDGSHVELDEMLVLTGKTVTMSSVDPAIAYGDGERVADLPVTATVRPGALAVLATA